MPNDSDEEKDDVKICNCSQSCGKALTERARRRHYSKGDPLERRPSVTIPRKGRSKRATGTTAGSSDDVDDSHDRDNSGDDARTSDDNGYSVDAMAVDLDPRSPSPFLEDVGMDVDDEDLLLSDVELLDLGEEDEWLQFDPEQEVEEIQTREEMERELEEMLTPEEEAALWETRNDILTEQDRDNIRAFQLKMICSMPMLAFAQMRYAFRQKLDISSHWVMIHRVAILSGVEPVWYDCCRNSCMAFTGRYADSPNCHYCDESRFAPNGKAQRLFCYLPIIPRLQGFFADPEKVKQLLYRHNYVHEPETIRDVFDSEHYRDLRTRKVVVDGKELAHCYFSGKHDIALSVCTDSYLIFERRRKGPSATPILAKIYNIHPKYRTHLHDLKCCGVIPGPKPAKDMYTFLYPFDEELVKLAHGVPTFDSSTQTVFQLRGYDLFGHGDIIAIEKMMNIKGHNSLSPCRTCQIKGHRNATGGETIYYCPLAAPCDEYSAPSSWDPRNLPLRTHEHYLQVIDAVDDAKSETLGPDGEKKNTTAAEKLAKYHGIKGLPALRRVGSLDLACSYPWDCMHLFCENNIPNLVALWSGKYKGLDTGREAYEILPEVWDDIWKETADAMETIPSAFCRSLAQGPSKFTAEAWCFWFVYMAPTLLEGRFSHPKYHKHACELSDIFKVVLQFSYTTTELDTLDAKIIEWVKTYERYYYQYREDRLCTCTLTVHGLLHVVRDIRMCGPSWTTWTFYMERYCGFLKAGLRSRRYPWANLNNRILNYAYLEQIGVRYDLTEELQLYGQRTRGPSKSEKVYENYPYTILHVPYRKTYTPDGTLRRKVAKYFASVLGQPVQTYLSKLPNTMPSWGKLRILDGDSIRTGSATGRATESERDSSYVRYTVHVQADQHLGEQEIIKFETLVCYGCLEQVLVCALSDEELWGDFAGTTRLLAVITPCVTEGKDATEGILTYDRTLSTMVTDVDWVSAVVGRIRSRGKWSIIDRSGGLIKPEFTPSSESEEQVLVEEED